MCVTCNIPLVEAESPQADDERQYLVSLINQGMTPAMIRRNMVATFGTGVLSLPPASGFDLAVYLVPIGVVVVLITVVALLLPRWRRRRAVAADRDGPEPATQRRRLGAARRGSRPLRPPDHIWSGALTPSRASAVAIVRCAASASASRNDSVAAGSAPTTRQSR